MSRARMLLRLVLVIVAGWLLALAIFKKPDAPPASGPDTAVPPTTLALTQTNFEQEVLQSEQLVMVDFWAPWCGPCRQLTPTVNELAKDYAGRAKIANLNIDDHPDIPQRYEIEAIPALLFFRDGKLLGRMSGAHSKSDLAAKLDELLGKKKSAT